METGSIFDCVPHLPVARGGMSALPPKADVCSALDDVRFGPKADMSFDDLVGERHHLRGNFNTERLCSSQIDDQFELR